MERGVFTVPAVYFPVLMCSVNYVFGYLCVWHLFGLFGSLCVRLSIVRSHVSAMFVLAIYVPLMLSLLWKFFLYQ